jgi:hypothetical protein
VAIWRRSAACTKPLRLLPCGEATPIIHASVAAFHRSLYDRQDGIACGVRLFAPCWFRFGLFLLSRGIPPCRNATESREVVVTETLLSGSTSKDVVS